MNTLCDRLLLERTRLARLGQEELVPFPVPQVYIKEDDCLESLKDLQRFLRRDDPATLPAFKTLGKFQIARRDLVPLILAFQDDQELVYNALKVAAFMTMPLDPMEVDNAMALTQIQRRATRPVYPNGTLTSSLTWLLPSISLCVSGTSDLPSWPRTPWRS